MTSTTQLDLDITAGISTGTLGLDGLPGGGLGFYISTCPPGPQIDPLGLEQLEPAEGFYVSGLDAMIL